MILTRSMHFLLLLLLWLALLDFPYWIATTEIDPGWIRCLGYFLTHRRQCGVDYLWTYGPLGYFVHPIYDGDLFWWKYAWELGIKFAFAWILLRWARLLPEVWTRIPFVALVLLYLPGRVDTLYLLCLVLLGLLPLRDAGCRTPGRLAAGTVLLALLSLTKFTFLLLAVLVWLALVLAPVLNRRSRITLAAGYPLALAFIWMLLGQALINFPRFLIGSLEIAGGYSAAMQWEDDPEELHTALQALALLAAMLAVALPNRPWGRERLLGAALLSASVILTFKHGLVRQLTHHLYFFAYLVYVPFAVEGFLGRGTAPHPFRAALALMVAAIGVDALEPMPQPGPWFDRVRENTAKLLAPTRLQHDLNAEQEMLAAEWELPEVQRLVGRETIDLFSLDQGVLLLNHLNYHPRPIFQGYSAYTPGLLERNAAFYCGGNAPAFLLMHLHAIDARFTAMEDGPALLEILHRYEFVGRENRFVLLKRLPNAESLPPIEQPVLLQRSIGFEEEVRLEELGAGPKLLSIEIKDSPRGQIRKALFRAPILEMQVQTTDGKTHEYRLLQGTCGSAFLLDPLVRNEKDVEALYADRPLPRVSAFSIHVEPDVRTCYQLQLQITVRAAEGLIRPASDRP